MAQTIYCRDPQHWLGTHQACWRAGKAVHLVLKRRQRRRSMFIWTESRGRTLIFWRTRQTMQAARPGIRVPAARGLEQRLLPIAIDHRERYPWRFPHAHAQTERRELPVGDYEIFFGNNLVAAVERKSLTDLISAASTGALRMQLAKLSSLPRGALMVEGRLSDLVKARQATGGSASWLLNLVAALHAEYPNVQWVFAENRGIAQDIAYRWLSAAVVILQGEFAAVKAVAESPALWTTGTSKSVRVGDRVGRQREAVDLARQGHVWTAAAYQEYFQVSISTACQDLKAMAERGELVREGTGRPACYVVPAGNRAR